MDSSSNLRARAFVLLKMLKNGAKSVYNLFRNSKSID